ncbi:MAG: hypothetical protein ABI353_13200, partial [Isosphaeraceae bacterium]
LGAGGLAAGVIGTADNVGAGVLTEAGCDGATPFPAEHPPRHSTTIAARIPAWVRIPTASRIPR